MKEKDRIKFKFERGNDYIKGNLIYISSEVFFRVIKIIISEVIFLSVEREKNSLLNML